MMGDLNGCVGDRVEERVINGCGVPSSNDNGEIILRCTVHLTSKFRQLVFIQDLTGYSLKKRGDTFPFFFYPSSLSLSVLLCR